jgi:hypothetical protein
LKDEERYVLRRPHEAISVTDGATLKPLAEKVQPEGDRPGSPSSFDGATLKDLRRPPEKKEDGETAARHRCWRSHHEQSPSPEGGATLKIDQGPPERRPDPGYLRHAWRSRVEATVVSRSHPAGDVDL